MEFLRTTAQNQFFLGKLARELWATETLRLRALISAGFWASFHDAVIWAGQRRLLTLAFD